MISQLFTGLILITILITIVMIFIIKRLKALINIQKTLRRINQNDKFDREDLYSNSNYSRLIINPLSNQKRFFRLYKSGYNLICSKEYNKVTYNLENYTVFRIFENKVKSER